MWTMLIGNDLYDLVSFQALRGGYHEFSQLWRPE